MPKNPPKPLPVVLERRGFLKLVGLASASLLPLACGDDQSAAGDGTDSETGGTGTGDGDGDGPSPFFPMPPLDDGELVDGTRVFRLQLQTGMVEWVVDNPTATYGANGDFLGPTLRFRKGERVRIEVNNQLGETTTLHWHGVEVPAASDGGPHQPIAAGETWISEYDVVQRAATVWYHPHLMHATARHVYMGIAGLIYIEDPEQTIELPSTYGVDDFPLVIQDRRFFADGTHPYSPGQGLAMHDKMAGLRGETFLVNGVQDAYGVVPQGLVRFRLLNGSNARIYNLGFSDDRSFTRIASDGGLLEAPLTTNRVLLAPGERVEILVDFSGDQTGATVMLGSFSDEVLSALFTGNAATNIADNFDRSQFALMTFEVGEPLAETVTPPSSFEPIERMVEASAVLTRPVALSMGAGVVAINGEQMLSMDSVPDAISFVIPSGSIEIWEVSNSSFMAHPLHLHNRQFQILDIDGQPPPAELAGWKDTVIVEPNQLVRIMIHFEGTGDSVNPYMFHCHILEHEDMGMMGQFFIVAP